MDMLYCMALPTLTLSLIFEVLGLILGLLAVWFLIKENIWTWPVGIVYVVFSLYIFWEAKLYDDFALHIFFLVMNVYGWWFWVYGKKKSEKELSVTTSTVATLVVVMVVSAVLIFINGYLLEKYTDASLPYWDSTTTILSLSAMWLTARKKIENWFLWLVVDILATGIYFFKELYFYSFLYLVYVGLAVWGYLEWEKSMLKSKSA
jgi:nicotinamide mononucleotide transporter